MLKRKIRNMIYDLREWMTDPFQARLYNATVYIGSYLSGVGLSAIIWIIIAGIYCLATNKKLTFVKR